MEDSRSDLVRILLVDDDDDCRLLVRDAIRAGNILNEVHEVSSAEEAMDFLHRRGKHTDAPTIGLVYLDIQMPGMSGQEMLKVIRSEEEFKDLPIVMMTSLSDDVEKEAAASSGANSYTVKPHDPELFVRTVIEATHYWVGVHQLPQTLKQDMEPVGTTGGN